MPKIICLLQARMSSSRLPNKVLKPIAGTPLVVLAAKRAANTGLDVRVVTSTDASDDILEKALNEHSVKYFRGSLHNTLARFSDALKDEEEASIVVRLTGDNLFPDGEFIEDVVSHFIENNLDYLGTTGEATGLPYGLSAEVFRVKALRTAQQNATTDFSKEHVTPEIIKKYETTLYQEKSELGLSHLRATVDTLDDYQWMKALFDTVEQPTSISYVELCNKLRVQNNHRQLSKLVVGSAQFGLDYGVTHFDGKPSQEKVARLISKARELGVEVYDTAQAYGDSEDVLSTNLDRKDKVISKLMPLSAEEVATLSTVQINEGIQQSLTKFPGLSVSYLVHRAELLWLENGKVWSVLQALKALQKIDKVGASVQTPEELKKALDTPDLDIIQMPFNILDNRWRDSLLLLTQYKQKRDVEVHVRSVFLQGLLLSENPQLWKRAGVESHQVTAIVNWMKQMVEHCQCASIKSLLIRYVKSQPWCDKLVIGMQNEAELQEAVNYIKLPPLTECQLVEIEQSRPTINKKCLNPATWKES